MKVVVMAIVLSLLPTLGFAEIYKWTDDNGKVHYSNKKPEKNKKDKVEKVDLGRMNVVKKNDENEQAMNKFMDDRVKGTEESKRKKKVTAARRRQAGTSYNRAATATSLAQEREDLQIRRVQNRRARERGEPAIY